MPPDAMTWLVGTLAVAVMGGVSGITVAYIRRPNNMVSKRDFDELRVEVRGAMAEVKTDLKRLGDKLETHILYHRDG